MSLFFRWSFEALIYDAIILVGALIVACVFASVLLSGRVSEEDRERGDQGYGFDE